MNRPERSEKKRSYAGVWPWVAIAVVIIAAAVIRIRLAAVPLERDEGEYAYIAQQMLKGVPPYVSAYSMKLPGIYAVYAMILAVFGQTQTGVHLGLVVFNAATIFVIFLLARRFFGPVAGVTAGGVYAVASLVSQVLGLWANAEHFVIVPALFGLWLIAGRGDKIGKIRLLTAGLLLGLAFIIKQTGIFFALFAASYIIFEHLRNRPARWLNLIISEIILLFGVVVPFVCVCLFYWYNGTFDKFWFWTNTYARKYTAILSLSDAWRLFKNQAGLIAEQTYPVWGLAILGLLAVIIVKRYRSWAVFAVGLLIFSFLAVCPGFYFREHYFILFLPSAAILCGAGLGAIDGVFADKRRTVLRVIITGAVGLVVAGYTLYNQRGFLFNSNPVQVCRKVYGANPFPEALAIAQYIRHNTGVDDRILVAGSEPEIYFYSDRRSATPYIYMYPLMERNPSAKDMQHEMISQIEAAKPRIIVFARIDISWLKHDDSVQDILTWLDSYSKDYYELKGLIELSPDSITYYWNSDVKDRTPKAKYWVAIFKRRQ